MTVRYIFDYDDEYWADEELEYWHNYDKPFEVYDEDEFGTFYVRDCYGEFEAQRYEKRGYIVKEKSSYRPVF